MHKPKLQKPKLIEVDMRLKAINEAAAREKSIRHGHPSTLHLWWSRKPLAACRAVLWASLVDDPSAHPDRFPTEGKQVAERDRLFKILEDLVKWENSNNPDVLAAAKAEIERCFEGDPPVVLDPFAGGGSVPLEAQRLGLRASASDLNPVAVLINKAMVEIPPRFAGRPPIHPDARNDLARASGSQETAANRKARISTWSRAQGLAADVKAYGSWMWDEAKRSIGHLYPDVVDTSGTRLIPIAWIWARTVKSPDPAWDGHVPLVASWTLRRARKNKPEIWVKPIVDAASQTISYKVVTNPRGGGGRLRALEARVHSSSRQRDLHSHRRCDSGGLHPGGGTGRAHGGGFACGRGRRGWGQALLFAVVGRSVRSRTRTT